MTAAVAGRARQLAGDTRSLLFAQVERTEQRSKAMIGVVVLAACIAVAELPLLPVYGTARAVAVVLIGATLGAGWAVVARGRTTLTVVAGVLVIYLVIGGPLAAPSTTLRGVLPTWQTIIQLVMALVDVWKQALTLQTPFGTSGTLLVLPLVIALVGSTVAASLVLRLPERFAPLAALAVVVAAGASLLFANRLTVVPEATAAGLVVVLIVWAGWQRGTLRLRRAAGFALVVVSVVAASVVAGPQIAGMNNRYILRDRVAAPFDPHDRPSPLAAFRSFVKDRKSEDLFTVSGLPSGARIRLATLDDYDGVVWNVAPVGTASGSGTFRRIGEHIATAQRGKTATVTVTIDGLRGIWLPTVGQATGITVAGGGPQLEADQLRYNGASGVALLTGGITHGLTYTLDAVIPDTPSADDLAAARAMHITLPKLVGVPDSLSLLASQVAGSATSPALVAQALTDTLSKQGWFSHGITDAGDYPSLSGHGSDRMAALVGSSMMVGDQEQYASALALMARSMGLPARVVVGFVPTTASSGPVTVTGADISAWVEIAYVGQGWVAYDPTPDASRTPQQDAATNSGEGQPMVVQPPPPPAPPVWSPDDDTERARTAEGERDNSESGNTTTVIPRWVVVSAAAGSGVLLLWLLPLALVIGAKMRRRTLRRRAAPVDRAAGAWEELIDLAVDARAAPQATATRSEAAAQVAAGIARRSRGKGGPLLAASILTVATTTDALVFSAGDPQVDRVTGQWTAADAARREMMSALPRRRRWHARVSIRSLRRAGRG